MQATSFDTLRDLVLYYGARRGWSTQRHIAVACGLDESALSRFLNGEQDIGARRTHALFQAVGIPVDRYDLAYALLGRAQDLARADRRARAVHEAAATPPQRRVESFLTHTPEAEPTPASPPAAQPWLRARTAGTLPPDGPQDGGHAPRDVAAIARLYGLESAANVPATLAAAVFAAEGFSGAEIAAFFGDRPSPPNPLSQ